MSGGWVAIHRSLIGHPDLNGPEEEYAFMWLILRAAFEPTTVRIGKAEVSAERGDVLASLSYLGKAWGGWSKSRVRCFLERAEKVGMLRTASARATHGQQTVCARITICNYDEYQVSTHGSRTASARATHASRTNINKETNQQSFPTEKNKGAGKPAPSFADFWEAAKVTWKSVNSPFGSKAEAENEWNKLSRRERWIAFLVLDFFAQSIRAQWTDSFRPNAKHVCRYLSKKLFREWADLCTEDDDEAEGRGAPGGRDEQRGADAPRAEDGAAHDDERVLRGGESLRGVCGGDGPVECAAPGGREGVGGLGRLPAPLGAGHAEPHHIRAGGVEHPRRDDLDANPLALGDDWHSRGRPAWVH